MLPGHTCFHYTTFPLFFCGVAGAGLEPTPPGYGPGNLPIDNIPRSEMSDSNCSSCARGIRAPITPHSRKTTMWGIERQPPERQSGTLNRYATQPYGFRGDLNSHQPLTRRSHYQLCYRSIWSRKRDSNPHDLLGRQACYPLNIIPTCV